MFCFAQTQSPGDIGGKISRFSIQYHLDLLAMLSKRSKCLNQFENIEIISHLNSWLITRLSENFCLAASRTWIEIGKGPGRPFGHLDPLLNLLQVLSNCFSKNSATLTTCGSFGKCFKLPVINVAPQNFATS